MKRRIFLIRVFSTPVEVFPASPLKEQLLTRFLHASGGVSIPSDVIELLAEFSPRQWRCFFPEIQSFDFTPVFSTPVEVFPYVICG